MLKILFLLSIVIIGLCNAAFCNDEGGMEIIKLPAGNSKIETTDKLSDILRHCTPAPYGLENGRSTQAHETVHIINSFTRNKLIKEKRMNAFYCGGGEAVVIAEPNLRIRHVSNFIPIDLRGDRYNLYFIDQLQYWDESPTYIIDEWSAYIAGAEVGVEDSLNDLPKEDTDVVCGSFEFSLYSVALCMATKEIDPAYWEADQRLRHSVNYFLIRSEKVFFNGKDAFRSKTQDRLLEALRRNKNTEKFRDFIAKEFDGIFLK